MSWRERAACLGKPLEWFFPKSGNSDAYRRGQAVCAECPVAAECRAERTRAERELRLPISGLWGGEIHGRGRRMLTRMGSSVLCVACGRSFPDRGTGPNPRYCSNPCSQRASQRRRRGLPEADEKSALEFRGTAAGKVRS